MGPVAIGLLHAPDGEKLVRESELSTLTKATTASCTGRAGFILMQPASINEGLYSRYSYPRHLGDLNLGQQ
jgi:hypothetical protein